MRLSLKGLVFLGVLGLGEVLGIGASSAKAQFVVGGWGFYGPRPFRRAYAPYYYGAVYPPPVVVAPRPVVVAPPAVVVAPRRAVYAAPAVVSTTGVVQTQYVAPAPYVTRTFIQPAPVIQTNVVTPYGYTTAPY